jgi:hypothetical protein
MMDWQTIVTYSIVAVAFALVIARAIAIFTGKRSGSGCPDCEADCSTEDEK